MTPTAVHLEPDQELMKQEMDEFESFLREKSSIESEGTIKNYVAWVNKLDRPLDFEEMQLQHIISLLDDAITNAYQRSAFKQYLKFKKRTENLDMDTRRRVNDVLVEVDSWDPKKSDGLTKTDVISKYLRVDEIQDFHTYIKRNTRPREFRGSRRKTDEYKFLPLFLFETGCRIKEALELKVAHIDFEENKIMIHDGKGGKARPVNMNHSAPLIEKHVENYDIKGDLFLIERRQSESHDYGHLTDKFKMVGEKLFGRSVTSHWFRHSFATNWAIMQFEKGVPKGEVKDQIREYLGHDDQQTTEAYIHAAEDLRRENIYKDGEFELEI